MTRAAFSYPHPTPTTTPLPSLLRLGSLGFGCLHAPLPAPAFAFAPHTPHTHHFAAFWLLPPHPTTVLHLLPCARTHTPFAAQSGNNYLNVIMTMTCVCVCVCIILCGQPASKAVTSPHPTSPTLPYCPAFPTPFPLPLYLGPVGSPYLRPLMSSHYSTIYSVLSHVNITRQHGLCFRR